jgi:hypothetical protein
MVQLLLTDLNCVSLKDKVVPVLNQLSTMT